MVRLTVHRPDRLPESFSYDEPAEISVGRSRTCTYCIESDPMVSRLHAVILIDPPSVRIKDLNSTNGLAINNERYGVGGKSLAQPVELQDGDEVMVGQTRIVVSQVPSPGGMTVARNTPGGRMSADDNAFLTAPAAETVSAMPPSMPPVAGYKLTRIISLASTGSVYLGVDESDGKQVAIKIFSPEIPFSRKTLEDFRQEIDAARRVTHPNLVRLLSAGELERGGMYLVMEYAPGQNLTNFIRSQTGGRLPLKTAYNLMLQLSSAVCYFHRHGFTHMDIKPASVIIQDDDGRDLAKITDQGFSRFLDETGILPRGYMGHDTHRLAYLPPEELLPVIEPKPTADIFSLSAVFYLMLTSQVPYNFGEGEANRIMVEKGQIVPIEERLPGLPEPLVVIVERGLSLDPEARYQTGCELLDALETVRV